MSIEKRIDYYLAGRRYVHPPLIELADDIAKEGKPALPILFNRLRTEQDDLTKSNIIYVFEVMHDAHYSLRNEAEVIHQLKQISIGIKDPRWKSRSEETIRLIVENKSPDR